MSENGIQSLLDSVSILIEKNNKLLDETGARFNVFKLCGVNHYENTHSKILAEFLNPKGSHGMGCAFLELFLEKVLKEKTKKQSAGDKSNGEETIHPNIDAKNCKVVTEVSFNFVDKENGKEEKVTGRMDIIIKDMKSNFIICIENKIYAGDQPRQIIRYNGHLQNEYKKNYRIFYLTLDGHEASKESAGEVDYTTISYLKHILDWVNSCIPLVAEKPMLRETLCQYRNHIKKLTGTHLEKDFMNEAIARICKSAENLEAAKEIARLVNSTEMREYLVTPLLNDLIKYIVDDIKLPDVKKSDLIFDFNLKSQKAWDHFGITSHKWDFVIAFKFMEDNYTEKKFQLKILKKGNEKQEIFVKDIPDLWSNNAYTEDKSPAQKNPWVKLIDEKEYPRLLEDYKNEIEYILPTLKKILEK